jgi:hypothetical protein
VTRSRRALAAPAIAAVLAVAAGCGSGSGGSGTGTGTGPGSGYHFKLPAHWQKRASTAAGVIAVYARSDHTALLTIRSEPRRIGVSPRFAHGIDVQLRRRLKGYRPLSHQIIVTKAGPTFLFTYTQTVGGKLSSILLVPAHGRSYILDAVSNPASRAATRDIAKIFKSFVPRS